jgi:dolichyl-phosphate-mannose--protein O-mannosyl transferase
VPAVLALLLYRRVRWYTLFWFGLSPVVHLLIWMAGLRLMGHAAGPAAVRDVILSSMASFHDLAKVDNNLASPWYTWPALYHPIIVKLSSHGIATRYASNAGNVVFWFPAVALVIGLPVARALSAWRARWADRWPAAFDATFTRAMWVLASGWLAMLTLFIVSMGKHAFFYHYLPPYSFAIILLAGVVAKWERRQPRAVLLFVALAVLVAIYFAPVWGEFSLTPSEANRRLLFPSWRP